MDVATRWLTAGQACRLGADVAIAVVGSSLLATSWVPLVAITVAVNALQIAIEQITLYIDRTLGLDQSLGVIFLGSGLIRFIGHYGTRLSVLGSTLMPKNPVFIGLGIALLLIQIATFCAVAFTRSPRDQGPQPTWVRV